MPPIVTIALMMGLASVAPVARVDHSARVDHHSGPVHAQYRGDVRIAHRQFGTVAPGGRTSTLRCQWNANMAVSREATAASGRTMNRSFVSDDLLSGSRAGWCSGQHGAIAQDVAARAGEMKRHMQAIALEDHDVLRAELDRAHGAVRTG